VKIFEEYRDILKKFEQKRAEIYQNMSKKPLIKTNGVDLGQALRGFRGWSFR
jgi:hypothetical protein